MNPKCDLANRPSYAELAGAWHALAGRRDLRLNEVSCEQTARSLLLAERGSHAPLISIAAGVHGDEPAGPWAVLAATGDGLLHERFAYRIWPCTNPSGYGLATRGNAEGADVNRSFSEGGSTPESRAICGTNGTRRFLLSIDVHEDPEAQTGFTATPAAPMRSGSAVRSSMRSTRRAFRSKTSRASTSASRVPRIRTGACCAGWSSWAAATRPASSTGSRST